jgi:hypothetical protein
VPGDDVVNLLWAGLIVLGVAGVAITAMLLVRRLICRRGRLLYTAARP